MDDVPILELTRSHIVERPQGDARLVEMGDAMAQPHEPSEKGKDDNSTTTVATRLRTMRDRISSAILGLF